MFIQAILLLSFRHFRYIHSCRSFPFIHAVRFHSFMQFPCIHSCSSLAFIHAVPFHSFRQSPSLYSCNPLNSFKQFPSLYSGSSSIQFLPLSIQFPFIHSCSSFDLSKCLKEILNNERLLLPRLFLSYHLI